jgi:hypothetical protein
MKRQWHNTPNFNFSKIKRPEFEADHWRASIAQWSHTATNLYVFMAFTGKTLFF